VSHALAQLRAHFDDPLLVRKSGKMMLTGRAQSLLPALDAALHELNTLVGAPLFDPATARRHFRIAMSDYAARIVLPPLLMILRESAPGFDLAISQASREMMLAQLEDGDVDLALGVFPTATNDIQRETLFPEQFICLADKRFLPANGKLTLEEWLEKPHVSLSMLPGAVDEIEKALMTHGLKRRICVALPHWSAAVSLLPGTDLVLTVASRSVTPECYHDALCQFASPLPLTAFNYQQAWHSRKNSDPAHQWLRKAIMASCESARTI
jgi:DNA-binding transcriptional LysR family regulator